MATPQLVKGQIEIPFVCPVCAGANAVHLISLSRAGGVDCARCKKWLRSADVMRAMHSPRAARSEAPRETRASVAAAAAEAAPRVDVVWPPTAASRAAAIPLRRNLVNGR
jgi:hypothetical protein